MPGVMLNGGPMDGWFVTPTAPALDSTWGKTSGFPGWAYVKTGKVDGVEQATWQVLDRGKT